MSTELHTGGDRGGASGAAPADLRDSRRPNPSGDLFTVLHGAPMFRRTVAGYDRFQVDTYVRWAEDELAAADREREHLVARHLRTRSSLDEATRLLAHSAGGGELLRLSGRIGSMLAAAADEAQSIRTEAEADRSAAATCAAEAVARAERLLHDAEAEAHRTVAEAAAEAEAVVAEAGRFLDEAEQAGREARAEAAARLEKVRLIELRAADEADRIRRHAEAEAHAARLHARQEIVALLGTAREQRRRAEAEAAATRQRLEQDTAARVATMRAEVTALERRRAALRVQVERRPGVVTAPVRGGLDAQVRRLAERLRWRHGSLRAP